MASYISMPVPAKSDYDRFYFGDINTEVGEQIRPSGYSPGAYGRWFRYADIRDENGNLIFQSQGEHFKDYLEYLISRYNIPKFSNLRVLELGCGKGFMVEDIRSVGIDCIGIDISSYAISQASPAVAPFVSQADALPYLQALNPNRFDVIFSFQFIECIEPTTELPLLVAQMNRVGRRQIHVINEEPNPLYYNVMTVEQYRAAYNWRGGGNTILIRHEGFYDAVQKVVTI